MKEEFEVDSKGKDSIEHLNSEECQCAKKRYIQIIDVDRYVDNLNDWD